MTNMNGTSFHQIIGELKFVPMFGVSMTYVFPFLLAFLVLLNLFDVYGRILRFFGLAPYDFTHHFASEKVETGRKLLSRARAVREKEYLLSPSIKPSNPLRVYARTFVIYNLPLRYAYLMEKMTLRRRTEK
eukprot:TRINITY_DN11714_c0_g1_i2.p1 TRINITY_DN11714_c0_g1~~TRINITY_DN11714_c0_g1_i2.p1  ORF type:complete len:131 (+),score=20.42 TRINITY_DN11714_c0_g1_i2:520-912(+)